MVWRNRGKVTLTVATDQTERQNANPAENFINRSNSTWMMLGRRSSGSEMKPNLRSIPQARLWRTHIVPKFAYTQLLVTLVPVGDSNSCRIRWPTGFRSLRAAFMTNDEA
jgi:hypothetical protein